MADEDAVAPVRYPRDPSLDPQLVWRGKDEQDSTDLEGPSVPVYVQEKCGVARGPVVLLATDGGAADTA